MMKKLIQIFAIMSIVLMVQSCDPNTNKPEPERVYSSIYGTITDAETGDPIPNAKITTHPYTDGSDDVICVPPAPHHTDSLGRYEITVNLGKRYISASVSHYEDTYYYDDIQSVIVDIVDATPVEMNFRFKKEYFQ